MKYLVTGALALAVLVIAVAWGLSRPEQADAAKAKDKGRESRLRLTVQKLEQILEEQQKASAAQAARVEALQAAVKELVAKLDAHIRQAQAAPVALAAPAAPAAGADMKQVQAAIDAALEDMRRRLTVGDRPVPKDIFAKLMKIAPGASVEDFKEDTKDGVKLYKVKFRQANGEDGEVEISEAGVVLYVELDLDRDNLPAVLTKALNKIVPDEQFRRARREQRKGRTIFRVETRSDVARTRLILSEKGEVIERDSSLKPEALPEAVAAFLAKTYPGARVRWGRHRIRDGEEYYEVEVRGDQVGKKRVKVNPDGTPFDEDKDAAPAQKAAPKAASVRGNDEF